MKPHFFFFLHSFILLVIRFYRPVTDSSTIEPENKFVIVEQKIVKHKMLKIILTNLYQKISKNSAIVLKRRAQKTWLGSSFTLRTKDLIG